MSDAKNEETEVVHGHAERHRRVLQGEVVSDKMDKTIVVQVSRRYRHPRYRKYVNERVQLQGARRAQRSEDRRHGAASSESRPLSRDKRWRLTGVLGKGTVL